MLNLFLRNTGDIEEKYLLGYYNFRDIQKTEM